MRDRITSIIAAYSAQGIHRTGTDIDVASAQWLSKQIETLGLIPELVNFEFNRFVYESAQITVGDTVIEGIPCYDCPAQSSTITGQLTAPEGDGDIVVVTTESGGNLTDELRNSSSYQALIVVTPPHMPADGIALINAEQFMSPVGMPVLQVSNEHGALLTQLSSGGNEATLVIKASSEAATGINVGTTIAGRQTELAPLVIMTPRSGWWRNASERGGGIACWLEIMRLIHERGSDRDVIFTANTGHELGHTGYHHFVAEHPELESAAHAWLHLGANFAAKDGQIRLQYSDAEIQMLAQTAANIAGIQEYDEVLGRRPGGEARAVYDAGGRYLSILGGNPLFHHPADVWPEAVDLDKTVRCCDMLNAVAVTMSSA